MITNLPKWYRIAAIDSVSEETLNRRSTAISALLNLTDKADFYLDCIRFYLSKPIRRKEFKSEFFQVFNSTDPLYHEDIPLLEKQILCGAIISEIIRAKSPLSLTIAMVVKASVLGVAHDSIINIDVVQEAINFLDHKSREVRQIADSKIVLAKYPTLKGETQTVESLTNHLKGVSTYIKDLSTIVEKQNSILTERMAVLEEESNIHWWLFRAFSNTRQVPVSKLDVTEAPFVLALELQKLYTQIPFPPNSEAFLSKLLREVPTLPESLTIHEGVTAVYGSLKEHIENENIGRYGNLSPLFFALSKILEADGEVEWKNAFEKQSGLSCEISVSVSQMASQFLSELALNLN